MSFFLKAGDLASVTQLLQDAAEGLSLGGLVGISGLGGNQFKDGDEGTEAQEEEEEV